MIIIISSNSNFFAFSIFFHSLIPSTVYFNIGFVKIIKEKIRIVLFLLDKMIPNFIVYFLNSKTLPNLWYGSPLLILYYNYSLSKCPKGAHPLSSISQT